MDTSLLYLKNSPGSIELLRTFSYKGILRFNRKSFVKITYYLFIYFSLLLGLSILTQIS